MYIERKHSKQFTFTAIAILLPFVLLFAVELIMRACGYGYDTHLFVEDKTGLFYQMNPDISKKYFTIEENATTGNRELFPKQKQQGVIRIFVLGASSSIGFPYMHNGSFSRLLKYRLQFAYPATNFEIINLSLTGINTYTLYDFSKQLIHYEPDFILIYAGHNEYYGALGVASTSSIGRNPSFIRAFMAAKNLRLVQWIARVTAALKGTDKRVTDYTLTLMERMAQEQSIPYQSIAYKQGIEQFNLNIGDMLDLFHSNQLPVFIGTLVSNQRSLKPFISSTNSLNANRSYEMGNIAYAEGDFIGAKTYYIQAKEYDELRFRAPDAINKIIRQQAERLENVHLVDVLKDFESHSPNNILDSTLLLEHVHPNLAGQIRIAETFYHEIQASGILPDSPTLQEITYPLTPFDSIYGDISILMLKELWPFNEPMPDVDPARQKTFEEQMAGACCVRQITWYDAMPLLYKHYEETADKANALKIMEGLCLEFPYNEEYLLETGKLCLQQEKDTEAWFYFNKMYILRPSSEAASNLAIALLKMDRPKDALPYIDRVIQDSKSYVNFNPLKEVVEEIITLQQQLTDTPTDTTLFEAIASRYIKIGNTKAASKYTIYVKDYILKHY
jgi:lysophospholipase L1-like esterase